MLAHDIKQLLRIGANIDLTQSSAQYTLNDLKDFARIAVTVDNSHLTITSNKLLISDLTDLARIGREKLTIVINS